MSSKPTLKINPFDVRNHMKTLGKVELLTCLIDSGLFEVGSHEERISTLKGDRAALLLVNGKKIYLDLWEYSSPTYSTAVHEYEMDLIIKLQHKDMEDDYFLNKCKIKNVLVNLSDDEKIRFKAKIVPWTFFPSRMLKPFIYSGKEIPYVPVSQFGFFCGKMWKCRKKICKRLEEFGVEMVASKQETRAGRPLSDDDYIRKMVGSKFGIIIHGRGSHFTEAKNRREVDYTFLGKPILMNYKPFYYNPMVEGEHFIYIDENTEFEKIEELYNTDEIARAGREWYEKNASPTGTANSFMQIMTEKGIV